MPLKLHIDTNQLQDGEIRSRVKFLFYSDETFYTLHSLVSSNMKIFMAHLPHFR